MKEFIVQNPKTRRQEVFYQLLSRKSFSMKDVINDSMFYKFGARLIEVESDYGQLAKRTPIKLINKYGNHCTYVEYSVIDKEKCLKFYNKELGNQLSLNI
tara:strand:+ start:144 stop:443 length:300 start_codon:yes stop_codon:yes gene_type:complete